jgi:hypothetical protein
MKTLITEHWAGQVRGAGPNLATRVAPVAQIPGLELRALFERAYPAFAARCRAVDEPGLALVAVDEVTGEAAGMACLRARVDRHVSAIVGRHDRCDLYLPHRERLALRQLAVVLAPVTDWRAGVSTVSFRVLDLRTQDGMVDEHGRPLRGLRSEGPAMVRCGGHALFALPLGDPTDWPSSARDAWDQLPARSYHDELVRVPDASVVAVARPRPAHRRLATVITRITGPRELGMPLAPDGEVAGRLWLSGPAGTCTREVGPRALRDGVLLGRYDRCDATGFALDESVSRVHALLLQVDERLLLIDVASTNGTRVAGAPDVRILEVEHDTVIELGHSLVVRWSWAS